MAIQIPAPLPSDSDKVVHLLKNAALFGRIGDTDEALHWLRQAAECAGDSGDDSRTLLLARSAAELSIDLGHVTYASADDGSGVRERRLPSPPPRSGSVAPDTDSAPIDEPVLLLRRLAPDSRTTLSPPPLPSVRGNGSRPPPASTRPRLVSSRPAPPSSRSQAAAPGAVALLSTSKSTPAASASSVPPPSTRSLVPTSRAPRTAVPVAAVTPSLRQAARVSVERSPSEPGLFLVRVLEEGKAPNAGCTEALLVAVDPHARSFAG